MRNRRLLFYVDRETLSSWQQLAKTKLTEIKESLYNKLLTNDETEKEEKAGEETPLISGIKNRNSAPQTAQSDFKSHLKYFSNCNRFFKFKNLFAHQKEASDIQLQL